MIKEEGTISLVQNKYMELQYKERKSEMKTIEEFYKEIAGSIALQNELKIVNDEMLGAFLKQHGCGASPKEFRDYFKSQINGEIGDDDAKTVAGGMPQFFNEGPQIPSQELV